MTGASPGAPARRTAVPVEAPSCALGESPRWAHGAWWWVDAQAGTVWTADAGLTSPGPISPGPISSGPAAPGPVAPPTLPGPDSRGPAPTRRTGKVRAVLATGTRVSLVHPAADGRVVAAVGTDLLVVDPRGGDPCRWSRVALPDGWLLNDGTADHAGRLWIGSVHPDRRRYAGSLHVVDTDGRVRAVAGGLTLSNGMAWRSPEVLVHADSRERCLWEHTADPRTGDVLHSRRTTLPPGPGPLALPDGVALDEAGGLWVAMYGTGQAWRLVDGRVHTVVEVPTPQVTSVALGGPDGRDLLITTAQEGMDAAALAADPFAGRLFHTRVDVAGSVLSYLHPGSTIAHPRINGR